MRNGVLLSISSIIILIVYLASSSFASVLLSGVTILLGLLIIALIGKSRKERAEMVTVMLVSFICFTIAVVLQFFDYVSNYNIFAVQGNDNYFFYTTSMEGVRAPSINRIFNECVVQNIHFENGGYYFYIKTLAYLAGHYADGNNLMLQQLGTAMPSILSSIFIYAILSQYCSSNKKVEYACFFMVLSPLILHSTGIHRDAMIAFFFFVLIYLWLCKDFSLKVGILQVIIAIILFFFREQHGLFALSFVVVSPISTRKQNWIVYYIAIFALIVVGGVTYLSDMLITNLTETNVFYEELRSDSLSGLYSGIGRYIYKLPFPIRELAQIFFLQLRFPPWLALSEASSIYAVLLGLLSFAAAFYWFYVFSVILVSLLKKGFKCLPIKLIFGLLLLFAFLFLSSANLDSRRVVCMYPLMYVPFVYYKDYVLSMSYVKTFRRHYAIIYAGICLLYLGVKIIVG